MRDQPMSDLQITRVLSCQSTNQTSLFVEDDIIAALLALILQHWNSWPLLLILYLMKKHFTIFWVSILKYIHLNIYKSKISLRLGIKYWHGKSLVQNSRLTSEREKWRGIFVREYDSHWVGYRRIIFVKAGTIIAMIVKNHNIWFLEFWGRP